MTKLRKLPDDPWSAWASRIILNVQNYLDFYGRDLTIGGRQRTVRDIAFVASHCLKKEVIIIQKAKVNFDKQDKYGNRIIGIKLPNVNVYSDPLFGLLSSRFLEARDAVIYFNGEHAWPFIVKNSKAYHTGVWWDGPFSLAKKQINAARIKQVVRRCKSICCCDTNVINWIRDQGKKYFYLSSKAIYVPNYADIKRIRFKKDDSPGCPIKILYARRFTNQRGVWLILESARLLKEKGINFHLFMLSPEGQAISVDLIKSKIAELGLSEQVSIINNFDLDSIYDFYEQVDISVVPTLWSEGTSYSCIESIVAGVPVVTTTVGGLPNIIIPDFNGIIEPPIPERLAGAVIKLMESKKWRELHENCFRMRDAFSKRTWETKIKEWIDS